MNTDQLEEMFEHFDWQKVHETMTMLNWVWYGSGVPSIPEMKGVVAGLAARMNRQDDLTFIGTGGFVLRRELGGYTLSFELATWNC